MKTDDEKIFKHLSMETAWLILSGSKPRFTNIILFQLEERYLKHEPVLQKARSDESCRRRVGMKKSEAG